jgi:hypothetical protein
MSETWIQTFTGRQFWPLDPKPEHVCLEDIAHGLAMKCRFGGQCREFYSVAQHSVFVRGIVHTRIKRCEALAHISGRLRREIECHALLHDAAEAYLPDIPRPIKRHIEGFREAESRVKQAVVNAMNIAWCGGLDTLGEVIRIIKEADDTALATEARDLMAEPPAPWETLPPPLPARIVPWKPDVAKENFLEAAAKLGLW